MKEVLASEEVEGEKACIFQPQWNTGAAGDSRRGEGPTPASSFNSLAERQALGTARQSRGGQDIRAEGASPGCSTGSAGPCGMPAFSLELYPGRHRAAGA